MHGAGRSESPSPLYRTRSIVFCSNNTISFIDLSTCADTFWYLFCSLFGVHVPHSHPIIYYHIHPEGPKRSPSLLVIRLFLFPSVPFLAVLYTLVT
jgi:hypothetical protein